MSETTARNALPLLAIGQAQKEMTHNEALLRLDMLSMPVVASIGLNVAPATPNMGECWITGSAPAGAWQGQPRALACWTAGGWRFAVAFDGMSVWSIADGMIARFSSGTWTVGQPNAASYRVGGTKVLGAQGAAISNVSGGSTADLEARVAINAILAMLRTHGLIAT